MKALLIDINLMVRVCVPDDATEDQIIEAAVNRAQELSTDRSWFGEGCGEISEDEETPYGEHPNDATNEEFMKFLTSD